MNSFFVYVLFSQSLDRFYIGLTTLSVEERLENHLAKKYDAKNFTQKANDWTLAWKVQGKSYSQIRKIEHHLKRMKSRKYLQNLIQFPELGQNLLKRFEDN